MPKSPEKQRDHQEGKAGVVHSWGDRTPGPEEIATQVRYVGNGKHKTYPSSNGEWQPVHDATCARCAHYEQGEWHKLTEVLQEAIRKSCVQFEADQPFPKRIWVKINGKLHEARRTNQETGEYHGFPLARKARLPKDPDRLLESAPNVDIAVH